MREVRLDGDRVVYRSEGKGPVLLLLHGLAGSSATWRRVMPLLARRFTVIAPDLLGQGRSDRPRGDYSLGAHASTMRDLMDRLGYERATVVGQSHGGGIAAQLAYQFPERCERLVLVDSGGLGPEVSLLLRVLALPFAEQALALACSRPLRAATGRIRGWLSHCGVRVTPAGEEMWRSYLSLADAERRYAFFRSFHTVLGWSGQSVSALRRLACAAPIPTLIVWGARDSIIPVRHAFAAHQLIADSRLVIFDGVGHYPHCEVPEQFAEAVVDFVAATKPARLAPRRRPSKLRGKTDHRSKPRGNGVRRRGETHRPEAEVPHAALGREPARSNRDRLGRDRDRLDRGPVPRH